MPVTSSRWAVTEDLADRVRGIAGDLGCDICLLDDPETALLFLRADPPPGTYFADVPPLGGFAVSFPVANASACDEYWAILTKPSKGDVSWTDANLSVLQSQSGVRMIVGRGPDESLILLIHPPVEDDFDASAFFSPLWPLLTTPQGCDVLFNEGLGSGTPIAADLSVADWSAALPDHPFWTVDVVASEAVPLRRLIDQFAPGSPGTVTLVSDASIPVEIREDLRRRFGTLDAYRIPRGYEPGFDPWSPPNFDHETQDGLRFPIYRRADDPSEPSIQIDVVHRPDRSPLLDVIVHHDDDAAAVKSVFARVKSELPFATHEIDASWGRMTLA